jgi:AcrR family transcriptional regulator
MKTPNPNAAPRKRPKRRIRAARQARSKATVDAIVTAGARILATKGWAGFTTNAVAAKAGVSIGSLYEYFPSKQAVCAAIMDLHLSRAEDIVAARLGEGRDDLRPDEIVPMLVRGFVDLHADDPPLHRVLSSEVPIDAKTRKRIARLNSLIVAGTAAMLQGRSRDPVLSARLLVDAADALTHRWIVDPAGKPIEAAAMAEELETMLGAYLRAVQIKTELPRG